MIEAYLSGLGLSNLLSLSPDAALWGHIYQLGTETKILLFVASIVAVAAFLILLVTLKTAGVRCWPATSGATLKSSICGPGCIASRA